MDFEASQASPPPAKRRTRSGNPPTTSLMELGSIRRRLAAAQEVERAASALLVRRLSDAKRLAAAVARESQPADLEMRSRASRLFDPEGYFPLPPDCAPSGMTLGIII